VIFGQEQDKQKARLEPGFLSVRIATFICETEMETPGRNPEEASIPLTVRLNAQPALPPTEPLNFPLVLVREATIPFGLAAGGAIRRAALLLLLAGLRIVFLAGSFGFAGSFMAGSEERKMMVGDPSAEIRTFVRAASFKASDKLSISAVGSSTFVNSNFASVLSITNP